MGNPTVRLQNNALAGHENNRLRQALNGSHKFVKHGAVDPLR
jgi:hypothetical protein